MTRDELIASKIFACKVAENSNKSLKFFYAYKSCHTELLAKYPLAKFALTSNKYALLHLLARII